MGKLMDFYLETFQYNVWIFFLKNINVPPHHQTPVCTQGSSTPCPCTCTGGGAASAIWAQCCVRPSHVAVMAISSSDLVPGDDRHTPRPHTPVSRPKPSLLFGREDPDTQSRACRYLVSLPETWGIFL